MSGIELCPNCGGSLQYKQVEEYVRGGNDVAVVSVSAQVCEKCGERLYSVPTVEKFEAVRDSLRRHETSGFQLLGSAFKVA